MNNNQDNKEDAEPYEPPGILSFTSKRQEMMFCCFRADYFVILTIFLIFWIQAFVWSRDSKLDYWSLFLWIMCGFLCPLKKWLTIRYKRYKFPWDYHLALNIAFVGFVFLFTILYWDYLRAHKHDPNPITVILETAHRIFYYYRAILIDLGLLTIGFFLSDLYCKKVMSKTP